MIKTVEFSGKTEDEAIELALEQLNLSRDDVSVEIIERAKTGFLGLKNTPAIVRIQYEVESKPENKPEYKVDKKAVSEAAKPVETFLEGLFERMGIKVDMEVTKVDEDTLNVILTSQEPGALIGRRGETLDAIQHLTNYVINRGNSSRIRINMDAENYRQRRNETLEKLASKTADRVIKTRRNMTLDPMNAYERHVIHSALQDNGEISTFSVGSEPNRRVVVAYGSGNSAGSSVGGGRARTYRNSDNSRPRRDEASPSPSLSPSEKESTDAVVSELENTTPKADSTQYREWS